MRTFISSLALLASLAACAGDPPPPASPVTGPVRHMEIALTPAGDDLATDAADYVAAELGLAGDDRLVAVSTRVGLDGLRHARLQEEHRGVPVFGSEVMVHADDTTFLGFNGTITTSLDGFDVEPALDDAAAVAIARSDRETASGVPLTGEPAARLVILPRNPEGEGADLAWQIDLQDVGLWTYFVGAERGGVLRKLSASHPMEQASGPGGNARVAWNWDARLDVEPDGGDFIMQTDRLQTLDHANGDVVVRGPLDAMPDPAANDAHGYAEVTLDMLRDWIATSSIDDNGMQIVSVVNDPDVCGYGPDNACWHGGEKRMKYGTGANFFYALSGGLDVVSHEINHGYTQHHAGLVYSGQSGGLNESFSDIAGTAAEFYHQGDADDFLIGEDVTRSGDPLRDMCNPRDFGSIDHLDQYERHTQLDDQGNEVVVEHEVHSSSGIGNKAFCLTVGRFHVRSEIIESVRRAAYVWYVANDSRWGADTTFTQACQGLVDAARAIGWSDEEALEIAQSWADVGVLCKSGTDVCVEDGVCDVNAGETCASCPGDCDSCKEKCGRFKKGKCKINLDDCDRCGDPSCGDGVCDTDEDDQNCGQDCGCGAPGDQCESVAPFGCFCDQFCTDEGDCCADKEAVCGP